MDLAASSRNVQNHRPSHKHQQLRNNDPPHTTFTAEFGRRQRIARPTLVTKFWRFGGADDDLGYRPDGRAVVAIAVRCVSGLRKRVPLTPVFGDVFCKVRRLATAGVHIFSLGWPVSAVSLAVKVVDGFQTIATKDCLITTRSCSFTGVSKSVIVILAAVTSMA